jgi:hypothetical protein
LTLLGAVSTPPRCADASCFNPFGLELVLRARLEAEDLAGKIEDVDLASSVPGSRQMTTNGPELDYVERSNRLPLRIDFFAWLTKRNRVGAGADEQGRDEGITDRQSRGGGDRVAKANLDQQARLTKTVMSENSGRTLGHKRKAVPEPAFSHGFPYCQRKRLAQQWLLHGPEDMPGQPWEGRADEQYDRLRSSQEGKRQIVGGAGKCPVVDDRAFKAVNSAGLADARTGGDMVALGLQSELKGPSQFCIRCDNQKAASSHGNSLRRMIWAPRGLSSFVAQ